MYNSIIMFLPSLDLGASIRERQTVSKFNSEKIYIEFKNGELDYTPANRHYVSMFSYVSP